MMGSTVLLSGCRQAEQQALYQYSDFLADAFNVPKADREITDFPSKRHLTLASPDRQLTLLESLILKQCDLLYAASDKNQILNKHQGGGDRFLFQVNLIKQLTHCLNTVDTLSPKERAFLSELKIEKQQKRPLYFWQLLFSDNMGYGFFFGHSQLFPLQGHQFSQASLATLKYLNQVKLSQPPSSEAHSAAQLNLHLEVMSRSRYLPSLLMTSEHAIKALDFATDLLVSQGKEIPCHSRRHPMSFNKLKAIFSHRYVALMQPYIATLNSELHQVMPLLAPLFEPIPEAIEAPTRQAIPQILNTQHRLTQASRRHQQQWQQLFTRCQ